MANLVEPKKGQMRHSLADAAQTKQREYSLNHLRQMGANLQNDEREATKVWERIVTVASLRDSSATSPKRWTEPSPPK
jgi:hypothetical protein